MRFQPSDAFLLPWHPPLSYLIEHNDTIAVLNRMVHLVGNHQSGQLMVFHNLLRQVHHHLTRFRIKRRSMFIQKFRFTRTAMTKGPGLSLFLLRYWVSTFKRFSRPIFNSFQGLLNWILSFSFTPNQASLLPTSQGIAIFSSIVKREAVPILGSWKTQAISLALFLTLRFLMDLPPVRRSLHPPINCRPRYSSKWISCSISTNHRDKISSSTSKSNPLRTWFSLTVPASKVLNIFKVLTNLP